MQAPLPPQEKSDETASAPRPLVRERVFETVRQAIIEGQIAPGARITERELCENFAISRTAAREVVRMLAAEKLVVVEAHRGLSVARLDAAQVAEIYRIRTELEVIVLRAFLAAASAEDLRQAQAYGEAMLAAGARGDTVQVVETMASFERFQYAVAGTVVAGEIIEHLKTRVAMLRLMALREAGQLKTAMQGVRAIIHAITARDAEAAEAAVRTFVARSGDAALRQLDGAP